MITEEDATVSQACDERSRKETRTVKKGLLQVLSDIIEIVGNENEADEKKKTE